MSIERDPSDIWYDKDPFVNIYSCKCGKIRNHPGIICDFCETPCAYIGDLNALYKGEIQNQLQRERPLNDNAVILYDLIWDAINNDVTLSKYYRESTFVHNYLHQIINRFCTECPIAIDVINFPNKYKYYDSEDFLPDVFNYFDYAFNTCRYGEAIVEKMIDTVEQDNIDEFLSVLNISVALRLAVYVSRRAG